MLEYVEKFMQIDFGYLIISIFTCMAGIIAIWQIVGKFSEIIGKPFKWYSTRNKDHKALTALIKELHDHKDNNNKVEEIFNNFMNEIKEEMKNYNQNRINDRKQSFEIQKQLTDSINKITNGEKNRDNQIAALMEGSKELLGDKIDQRYDKYIKLKGIPQNEVDEFDSIYAAYKGLNGNHGREEKYKYVKNHLPVLPTKTEIIKDI